MARAQQADALLVACQRVVEAEAAVFQVAHDLLEVGEGLLEMPLGLIRLLRLIHGPSS